MNDKFVIAFHTDSFNVRGTCVAIYDYAHYAELWYDVRAVIISKKGGDHSVDAIRRFRSRFPIDTYDDNLDSVLDRYGVDAVYGIVYGGHEEPIRTKRPLCIHCAFCMWNPYSDIYLGVSDWVASKPESPEGAQFVPHIISLKPLPQHIISTYRKGIPKGHTVFGRIGGADVFNFGHSVISRVVREREDVWFLLMNVNRWDDHPRIKVYPPTSNLLQKQLLISACDAMIVPELMGHTFGLSIAEFCRAGKPIVCLDRDASPHFNRQHLDELGEHAHLFRTEEEFRSILLMDENDLNQKDTSKCYQQYRPHTVMDDFNRLIIQPLHHLATRPKLIQPSGSQ
jgi:hypothetical protein